MLRYLVLLIISLASSSVLAQWKEVSEPKKRVFGSAELRSMNAPDNLTEVGFVKRDYVVTTDGPPNYYGTKHTAWFRTKEAKDFRDFLFVEFIRGCSFTSKMKDGKKVVSYDIFREHMGTKVTFYHPSWEVNANGTDPSYTADLPPGSDRHYFLEWGDHKPTPARTYWLAGEEAPTIPFFHTSNLPSGGMAHDSGNATNTSTEHRTCLYRAKDVPLMLRKDDVSFATPIACNTWSNSHVYDHHKQVYVSPKGVVPECRNVPEEKILTFVPLSQNPSGQ